MTVVLERVDFDPFQDARRGETALSDWEEEQPDAVLELVDFDPFADDAAASQQNKQYALEQVDFDPFETAPFTAEDAAALKAASTEVEPGVLSSDAAWPVRSAIRTGAALGDFSANLFYDIPGAGLHAMADFADTAHGESDPLTEAMRRGGDWLIGQGKSAHADWASGRKFADDRVPQYRKGKDFLDDPSLLLNPGYMLEGGADAAGSMLPVIAAAMSVPVSMASTAGGVVGGLMEGGGMLADQLKKGVAPTEALGRSTGYGLTSIWLNKVGLDGILSKEVVDGLAKRGAKILLTGGKEALTEWLEGPVQAIAETAGKLPWIRNGLVEDARSGLGIARTEAEPQSVVQAVAKGAREEAAVIPGTFMVGAGGHVLSSPMSKPRDKNDPAPDPAHTQTAAPDPSKTQAAAPDPAHTQAAADALDQGREVDLLNLSPTDPATPPPAAPSAPAGAAAPTVADRVDDLADTLGQMNDVPVVDEANEINPAILGTPEGDAAFKESQRVAAEAAVPVGGEFVPDGAQPVAPVAQQAPNTPFTPEELQGMMSAPAEPGAAPPLAQGNENAVSLTSGAAMESLQPAVDLSEPAKAPWQMTQDEYLEAKPDGPKSRMNTHERHVREALEQGLPVPPEVLARYKGRYWMERQPAEPVNDQGGGFGGGEGAAPPGHVSIFDQAVSFGEVAGQHKQEGMDDRGQSGAGGEDVGQAGQGFQQDHGGPVGDVQAGTVQQDDQGQGGSLQAGSFVEDQSRIAEALDYADNVTRHLVDAGALTEEEAGLIEQAERDESETRLADLAYEMSMHAEVRDHALDIHERVISRIRKLGGINYDHAREQMGRDGIQWMQSRFGLGFVSRDGAMLDELADMLSAEVPELAIDREVQNLMDLLRDRVQSKKAIEQDYSRAVDDARTEIDEILRRLQERQDYREGKEVFDQRAESDTEQANAPPHDPAQKPNTLREVGKEWPDSSAARVESLPGVRSVLLETTGKQEVSEKIGSDLDAAVGVASETVRAGQNGGEYGKERTLAESEPENEREGDISGRRGADSDSGAEPGSAGRLPGVRSVLLKTAGEQEVPARIESDLDAAVAVASLAEQPQENMVALVLDAKNKPLVILHHSKGATSSTVAESSILAGSVLDVPGARYVYLAHNHPGEKAELSPDADMVLANVFRDLFTGSGVEMLGMLAVTSNSFANELGGNIPIPVSNGKGKRVPVQVRVFSGVYEPERVIRLSDPDVLIEHSKTITGGADSGIVLLNTQNVVVGFVPMSPQDMATLRGNGLGNILKALHRANANGVLGIIPGIFDTKAWHNVAALARAANVRVLDVLYQDAAGNLQSFRGNGYDVHGYVDVFFSRADRPTAKGMPAADVQGVVDTVAGNWAKAPVVNVVQSVRDLPAKILGAVRKAGAEGDVQAVYHNGTVYIIADRMADVDHVRRTLLHEGTGHHGLRLIMRKAELNRALDLAWENAKVRDAAGEIASGYKLDLSNLDQRREAVEEVLAHWAETGVRARALDRFVAAVRRALRRVFPGLKMTDADVLDLIVRARRATVEGKGVRAVDGGGAKMSRNPADIGMITEEIAAAIGWQAGPIRLGPGDMTHIIERHQREIERMGFSSVRDFVMHVVENFDAAYQGHARSVLLVVRGVKTWKTATVKMEFDPAGNFWRVVSASPMRLEYFVNELGGRQKKKLLWERAQTNHRLAATPDAFSGQSSSEGNISATDEDDNTYLSRGRGRKSISIDGIERPAVNSEGRPIHGSAAGIVNFWRWFDGFQRGRVAGKADAGAYSGGNRRGGGFDSADGRRGREVGLDDRGRPRVFFHGTAEAIDAFDLDHPNRKDNGWLGRGVYLISDVRIAETYANLKGRFKNQAVMPLYVAVRNPYFANLKRKQKLRRLSKGTIARWTQRLKDQGFDGVVLDFPDGTIELVAFYPEQVKSVTGNAGSFDAANDDIRFSRGGKKTKPRESAFKTRADAAEAGMQTGADTGALKEPLWERAPTNHRLSATPSAISGQSGSSDESLETFGEGDNTRFFRVATQVSQTVAGMATPMTPEQIAAELEANRTFANKIHEGRDQVQHQVKVAATEMQRAVQRLANSKKWKYNPLNVFSSEKELKDSSRSRLLDAAMLVHREMQINPAKVQEFKDWAREQLEVKKIKGAALLRIQDQLRILEAAENLTIEQKHFVDETMNSAFETVGAQAKNAGVVNTLLDNYVRRLWNRPQDGDKAVFSGAGHAFKTFTTASKARTLETIFDGWMKGYDLQIKGITSSWAAIAGEIGQIVAGKQFIQEGRAQGVLSARAQKGYVELQGKGFHVWVRKAGVKIRMRDMYGLLGTDGQGRKMYVSVPNRYWAVYADKGARRADTLFDNERDARAYAEELREQGSPGAWVEFRQEVDIFEKVPLYAPEKVADLINRMTRAMDGDSPWKAPLPRAILAFNNAAKGWILMTSFFHHLAGARSWAFGVNQGALEALRKGDVSGAVQKMASAINPVSAHKRGLEKIRTNHAVLRQLIRHGLTVGELADWSEGAASEHRGITDRLFTHLSGRMPGAEKVVAAVRGGRFFRERAANALFKRYFAGLKAEAAVLEYGHQLDAEIREANREGRVPNPDLVAERVARLVNDDFGGLHLARMGRHPGVQAGLRLLLLAPDWTESNWRTITGMVPGLNDAVARMMHEVPAPPGMDKVYRRFWARIIVVGALHTLALQVLVSALLGDDDDHWYDLYRDQFADWDTLRRMKWTGVDVTPIYERLGMDLPKGERKVFSVIGHFADFLRILDPASLIKGKLSPLMRIVGALGTKTDYRERPFTGVKELATTGRTVKNTRYEPKELFFSALPSILTAQLRDLQPIQVGYLLKYLQGEEDGLTALLASAGAHMSAARKPDVLGKEYEAAALELNRVVKRARELGELRAALLALDKEDPAAAAALRKERADDIKEARTFRRDNEKLLRLYPAYSRVREALGQFDTGKRLQEAYVLDKNKRSTSVDTLDENIEKLKRTFVEKYRKAG